MSDILNSINASKNTLNMWSANGRFQAFVIEAPRWINLAQALAYTISVSNTTDQPIDSGVIELEGASPRADNPCLPDTWGPIDPIEECGAVMNGAPWPSPVKITITADRPIAPYSSCHYAFPCPLPFLRATSKPAGVDVIAVITRFRRTDNSYLGPFGGIPKPLQLGVLTGTQQQQLAPPQGQPQQQTASGRQMRSPQLHDDKQKEPVR